MGRANTIGEMGAVEDWRWNGCEGVGCGVIDGLQPLTRGRLSHPTLSRTLISRSEP